ncbi:MAG: hypothetical protein KGJ80_15490, partial [Chloroflexota bacterium]|nr:hypothetical protein [Chloroflexota bacterium]
MNYAQVVVNTPLGITKPREEEGATAESSRERAFTYSIPTRLAGQIALGQLVWVPFGARRLQGVVIALSDTSPVEQTKDVDEIAEPRPFLSAAHIDLARWIARTYLCSLNDAIQLMLPLGVEQEPEILVSLAPDVPRDNLSPKQSQLVELVARKGETKLRALPRELRASVDALARRGILVRRTQIEPPRAKPKHVKAARLVSPDALSALKLRPAQSERYNAIVDFLRAEPGAVWISAVYAATNSTLADLKKLEAAGVIALEEEEVWRDSLAGRVFDVVEPPRLTPEQENAWNAIAAALATRHSPPATFLLHGVTGSGKT